MRLTEQQIQDIKKFSHQVAGDQCTVRVFGSRIDDEAHGGDLDIMLESLKPVDNPALLAAKTAALISRAMYGRKVDVLILAPNLMHLPIHNIALEEGIIL